MTKKLPALLAAVAVLALSTVTGPATASTLPRAATTTGAATVSVTLNSMSPRSPDARKPAQPVTILATITNNTDNTYSDVQFGLQRGFPITQQNLLDAAIRTPPETDYDVASPLDLNKQLLPRGQLAVSYHTTANDLCLCFDGVYPYALVVKAVSDPAVGFVEVGRTQVFVPSFPHPPKPVTVGWVWPLLDKPHRTIDENVFTDESLAGEVGPGGRLDRALKVAELVAGTVPLTLLVDPDLLDSLAVMASPAGYRVKSGTGTVAGTGGRLAEQWLARLHAVKDEHDLVLTAYADPDINAVVRAGLKWSTALDPQVQARISPTLDGDFSSDLLTWPIGSALTSKALDALVGGGASTVLLSDASLPGQNKTEPRPDALSPLPSAAGKAVALVTDTAIEATARRALQLAAMPQNDQQTLLAQLAIRAAQDPTKSHFVVIAPDRYVDPDPASAAATISSITGTTWSQPIRLRSALDTVTPVDRGALQTSAEDPAAEISTTQLANLSNVQQQVASMNEALHDNDAAAQLLAGFNNGIQRAQSSAWRTDPVGGANLVRSLQSRIDTLTSSIHLVKPAIGTYSLSSSDSPVVVTVANQLSKPVTVQVVVRPGNGVIGFESPALAPQTIPANSIETIRVPTHVVRLGQFQVVATLLTPDGRQLGQTVTLNLRATAIGTVTKIITVVAVSVLVLLLLRRLVLRIKRGRAPAPAAAG
ncbi:MAG: DUF6049 family protein [Actinomycetota bacterium]|nr:DUF6049 family protein [Actinomycetota bacterium]